MTHKRKGPSPATARPLNTTRKPAAACTGKPTEPGLYLLLAELRGVVQRREQWPAWKAFCPCHPDEGSKPSLWIDYKPSKYPGEDPLPLVWCRFCQYETDLEAVCNAVGLSVAEVWANNEGLMRDETFNPEPEDVPSDDTVEWWHNNLMNDDARLRFLYDVRGLDEATVRRYSIGCDPFGYYFPVKRGLRLVNVRCYRPGAEDKMKGLRGHHINLYPFVPIDNEIVLAEGELDALVCLAHGIPAVTSTGGVAGWRDTWTKLFTGKVVHIIYDCDKEGRTGAHRRAVVLGSVAASVTVVDLGLGDGEDLTDWFVKYGRSRSDLLALVGWSS